MARRMLFVDFIWFPEQATIALGNADVMCLLWGRAETSSTSGNRLWLVTSATITIFSQYNCSWPPCQLMVDVGQNVLREVFITQKVGLRNHITLCS